MNQNLWDLVKMIATLLLAPIVYIIVHILINPLANKQKTQVENHVETVQKREKDIELLKKTFEDLEREEEWNNIKDQM